MTMGSRTVTARPGVRTLLGMGFVLALVVLVGSVVISATNTRRLAENVRRIHRTTAVLGGLERLLSTLEEAEAGLRGYLLTGQDDDLEAYDTAVTSLGVEMRRFQALLDGPE